MSDNVSHLIPGRCCDPNQIVQVAQSHGLEPLDAAAIAAARDLASKLVPGVASIEVFQAVQKAFAAAIFGFREGGVLTGILAAFPLNERGFEQLKNGRFDTVNVDVSLVAPPGEKPAAYYGWGFAASTKQAGRAVVKASAQIHHDLYWATPTFARAVTPDGMRALTALGFRVLRASDAALLWIAPTTSAAVR